MVTDRKQFFNLFDGLTFSKYIVLRFFFSLQEGGSLFCVVYS